MATENDHAGDGADEEEANKSSFYGEDIFDDLIDGITASKNEETEVDDERAPDNGFDADAPPDRKISIDLEGLEDGSQGDSTTSPGDAGSLDSGEISGESDVSEVEEQMAMKDANYVAPPLINDDESTVDMRPPAPQSQTVSSYVDQLNQREKNRSRMIKAGAFAICIAIIVGVALAITSLTGNDGGPDNGTTVQEGPFPGFPETEALTGRPTPPPTMKPVAAESVVMIATVHPVQLTFENLPADYRMSADHRKSIITFLAELLTDYLDKSFELEEVAYARNEKDPPSVKLPILLDSRSDEDPPRRLSPSKRQYERRLASVSLPLRFVMIGPSNFSQDFVRSYVVEILTDRSKNILNYVKALDWNAFKSARVTPEIYSFGDLIEPTASPTPQTPTVSPVGNSTESPVEGLTISPSSIKGDIVSGVHCTSIAAPNKAAIATANAQTHTPTKYAETID
ncbi:hypothetical protein ACHAXT_000988 [Thalassiosira profunda]